MPPIRDAVLSTGTFIRDICRHHPKIVLTTLGALSAGSLLLWCHKRHMLKMTGRQSGGAVKEAADGSAGKEDVAMKSNGTLWTDEKKTTIEGEEAGLDAKPCNLQSVSSSDMSDTDSHSAKSSGDRFDADFDAEEPAASLESAGSLQLEVCESFSWAEDMEKSYSEALASEQRKQETVRLEAYDAARSPGLASQEGSEDSGRATGGLASSLSPLDDVPSANTTPNGTLMETLPMYEFEIPNSLVGLIIGVKGKTIKELSTRTEVKMLIRAHHTPEKVETHQICQVRGKRSNINLCLQMLRKRFQPERFPELNLQPVIPPLLPENIFGVFGLGRQPSWLTLSEGVSTEATVVHTLDCGHFFVQQPTHPSFCSLGLLDLYMIALYASDNDIPNLGQHVESGVLCAAPVMKAWFRAVTVIYYAEEDEVLVRFVDYGGYSRIPRKDLRQIRTDLISLPFQATECYLAHVQPVDGTTQWSPESFELFLKMISKKVLDVTVVGYCVEDRLPMVEVSFCNDKGMLCRVDRMLMEAGHAKAADPTIMTRLQTTAMPAGRRISRASHSTEFASLPAPHVIAV